MKYLYAIHHYDTLVLLRLANISRHIANRYFWFVISKTGDGPLYGLIFLACCYCFGLTDILVRTMLLAFVIERPIYFILKNTLQRNRPQEALLNFQSFIVPHDKFSFPSGHTSAAFLMATLVGIRWPFLLAPLYVWASGVGMSRVMLGVHFPTDILAGASLGLLAAESAIYLV